VWDSLQLHYFTLMEELSFTHPTNPQLCLACVYIVMHTTSAGVRKVVQLECISVVKLHHFTCNCKYMSWCVLQVQCSVRCIPTAPLNLQLQIFVIMCITSAVQCVLQVQCSVRCIPTALLYFPSRGCRSSISLIPLIHNSVWHVHISLCVLQVQLYVK